MSTQENKRQLLIDKAQNLHAANLGQGAAGNLSVRDGEGFLITPSALDYASYQLDDIVFMQMDGSFETHRKPSSEWRFHRDIYAVRDDVHAVVHTHAPACTTLACLHMPIPAFHYMVAIAGGDDIPCAPYATFGTQALSDHVIDALRDRNASLLANHGMICVAENLIRAFNLAIEVEELADMYCRTLQIGKPELLSGSQMAKVREKFTDYKKLRE